MNIGEAARSSGVSVKMIRHHETIGLLPSATRSEGGYRLYRMEDVHALRFIGNARALGFPLAEIAELLGLWRDRARASAEVKQRALAHLAAIDAKVKALQAMSETLHHLVAACHGDHRPECPILEGISGSRVPPEQERKPRRRAGAELRHAGVPARGQG